MVSPPLDIVSRRMIALRGRTPLSISSVSLPPAVRGSPLECTPCRSCFSCLPRCRSSVDSARQWGVSGGRGLHAPYRLFPSKVTMDSMMGSSNCWANASAKVILSALMLFISHCAVAQRPPWLATWATSAEAADADPDEALLELEDQTVRQRGRIRCAGSSDTESPHQRIRPLARACREGERRNGAEHNRCCSPGSLREVTFSGKSSIVIPPGAPALSDPIDLAVASSSELAISLYFPKRVTSITWHLLALNDTAVSPPGDHTEDLAIESGW